MGAPECVAVRLDERSLPILFASESLSGDSSSSDDDDEDDEDDDLESSEGEEEDESWFCRRCRVLTRCRVLEGA